jgi:hypothetical protein
MITGKELAEKVLAKVAEHPEQHRQAIWVEAADSRISDEVNLCGTRACLAGWAVLLNREPGETPMQTLWRLGEHFGFGDDTDWERVAVKLLLPDRPIIVNGEGCDEYDERQYALTDAFYTGCGGNAERAIENFRRAMLDWAE